MSRLVAFAVAVAAFSLTTPAFAQHAQTALLKELEAECNAGDGFACKKWGVQLTLGVYQPADPVKARVAYEKGCKLKDSQACAKLFKELSLGEGGPKDLGRAKKLEGAACNHGMISVQVDLESRGLCKK